MRRVGKVLTGVDRVELAYLSAFLETSVPAFGLVRAPLGYILLDKVGLEAVHALLAAPHTDLNAKAHRRNVWRQARRLAIGRVPPVRLGRLLKRTVPRGAVYVNVGHSNLTDRVLGTVKSALDAKIAMLIHDVIPLEYPEYQREGSVPKFRKMLARVSAHADYVIYNSADTQTRTEVFLDRKPSAIVAHLGTVTVPPDLASLPAGLPLQAPYFVCVGTIEPRKNHAFLLDIWEELGEDAPGLVIVGSRGWRNEAVFDRLDGLPTDGPVREVSGLEDAALSALIHGAQGVLFPTHAEGFGLPATEAAALGVPVIVNDLDVFREIMGDIPIYASVSDRYLWMDKIKELAVAAPNTRKIKPFDPPTWAAHFKIVLRLI